MTRCPMPRRHALALIAGLALAPVWTAPVLAQAGDPAVKQIQTFYDTLLSTMKKGKELGAQGRYDALEPVVEQTFNLPFMTQYTVGPAWSKFSDAEKAQAIAAYKRMTVAEYAGNFDSFDGQTFTVDPKITTRDKDKIVQSTLTPKGEKPISFIYRMRETNGQWKVIDVFLDGFVSQLATKRSDYASTVASGGAPALVKALNAMADKRLK